MRLQLKRSIPIFFLLSIVLLACFSFQIPEVYATGITRVQGNVRGIDTSGSNSSLSITLVSTPTTGNLLVACIGASASPVVSVSSISETGVTWTRQVSLTYVILQTEIWVGVVGSGASTLVTITFSGTCNGVSVADICEYSGLLTSGFLDKTASTLDYGSALKTGTTDTTTEDNELWVGAIFNGGGVTQSTPINGFTLLDGSAAGAYCLGYFEKIVSSTGVANSGATGSGDCSWDGCIATFKAAAGGQSLTFTNTETLKLTDSLTSLKALQVTQTGTCTTTEYVYGNKAMLFTKTETAITTDYALVTKSLVIHAFEFIFSETLRLTPYLTPTFQIAIIPLTIEDLMGLAALALVIALAALAIGAVAWTEKRKS